MLRAIAAASAAAVGAIPESEKGQPNGVCPLDGQVPPKIPSQYLPPLQHDIGQAADQAGMLALSVEAPAICVRTDFTPPHIFFLTADPASTLANWVDTGEYGGPVNLGADYAWTGKHSHTQAVTFIGPSKNYDIVSDLIDSDDRLIFRANSAIEARYWFDSNGNDTGISLAEGGVERVFFGTELAANFVLDTKTYGFKLKTSSGANFAFLDTSILTTDRTFQFPDSGGTFALTSSFASGVYTPTVTPGSNTATATANGDFVYSRIGSTVHICGELAVTAQGAGPTLIDFSLPVAPPDFASTHQLSGSGAATTGGATTPFYARSNTGTKNGTINWIAPNTSAHTFHFIAMYTIS